MIHRRPSVVLALAAAGLVPTVVSCGGVDPAQGRFVAVHNAMTAMGLSQTGAISQGSLAQGDEAQIDLTLEAGECYTMMALGEGPVTDIDVRVLDGAGEEITRDGTHDRQAAVMVCAGETGEYRMVVTMARGRGGYMATSWSGATRRSTPTTSGGGGQVAQGSCQQPTPLEISRPVQGSTSGAQSQLEGSCAGSGAPEVVYRFQMGERGQFSAVLQSQFDGALYLQTSCGNRRTEVTCNDDSPDTTRSEISTTLEPGTYFLVVDGFSDSESGAFELIVSTAAVQPISAICGGARALPVGRAETGTTAGMPDTFQATCGGGAQSADRVYRLDVPGPSRLRIRQQSDHDGVVYVRTNCEDPTSEIACNDDFVDATHSVVTTLVGPGTLFVYTDGFSRGAAGNYNLTAELTADGGTGGPGDQCSAPLAGSGGQTVQIDTFEARDDYTGSCGGAGAPDVVTRITTTGRSRVRAEVTRAEFSGAVYLQATCGDASTEQACVRIDSGRATLEAVVPQGTYFLVVDGQSADAFGSADIALQIEDTTAMQRVCRSAPLLRPGSTVRGDTSRDQDQFQATCAGQARSPDTIYRLRLRQRRVVRLTLSSDYDGALHIRRDCADPSTELACDDDTPDTRHSQIQTTLDPGTYTVIVDGFGTGNAGPFSLDLETSAP